MVIDMRILLQRVSEGRVTVDGKVIAQINKGLVIFVGIKQDDNKEIIRRMAEKIVHLRIFEDSQGKTNLSALEIDAELLVISQFTLYADCRRGRRPGFSYAADPKIAEPLYQQLLHLLQTYSLRVAGGVFGAHMLVEIHNDGPFTILLDSDEK